MQKVSDPFRDPFFVETSKTFLHLKLKFYSTFNMKNEICRRKDTSVHMDRLKIRKRHTEGKNADWKEVCIRRLKNEEVTNGMVETKDRKKSEMCELAS